MSDAKELTAPIAWARSIGERKGLRSVIVLQELTDGRWGYTSWGRNRKDCGRARRGLKDEGRGPRPSTTYAGGQMEENRVDG